MGYDVNYDPYIDPSTGVLRNKFGAKTLVELEEIETMITSSILASLHKPENFTLTSDLIFEIHLELFGDIYDWAGKPRTIDISKGDSYFAHAAFITPEVHRVMKEIEQDRRLKSNDSADFTSAIAHFYAELNAIHPFREGNGRTIRALLSLITEYYGWEIDWSNLDKDANIQASAGAMSGDESVFKHLLSPLVSKQV